jgi:hypothetical protein
VLLYRGTSDRCPLVRLPAWLRGRNSDAEGRWFTPSLDIALWYVRDAPDGVLVVVDVPDAVALSHVVAVLPPSVQRYSRDPHNEVFLPREWAERACPT